MFDIALCADGPTPDFWQLVDLAEAFEDEGAIRASGYAPYVTLARYEGIDPALLRRGIADLGSEPPLLLRFRRMATFDTDPLVIWLAPILDERLAELHHKVHAAIGPEHSLPAYRPGRWVPHCDLPISVAHRHRDAARTFAAQPISPVDILLDRVDAFARSPVRILSSAVLLDR